MRKANEPAYPVTANISDRTGLSKREKLAMEIYARQITKGTLVASEDQDIRKIALISLRAADIFFQSLDKQ